MVQANAFNNGETKSMANVFCQVMAANSQIYITHHILKFLKSCIRDYFVHILALVIIEEDLITGLGIFQEFSKIANFNQFVHKTVIIPHRN